MNLNPESEPTWAIDVPLLEILTSHRPSQWRSFTTEEIVYRCCGQDFGPVSRKRKRDAPDAYQLWAAHVAHAAISGAA